MANTFTPTPAVPKPLNILVADDNTLLRTAVRELLLCFGHSVDVVTNGREAVEAARKFPYDLVFLDMQMPEMGGMEASRLLRRTAPKGLKTHLVGFSGEDKDRNSYESAGMDDFVVKPVRLVDLARVLSQLT